MRITSTRLTARVLLTGVAEDNGWTWHWTRGPTGGSTLYTRGKVSIGVEWTPKGGVSGGRRMIRGRIKEGLPSTKKRERVEEWLTKKK